MKLVMWGLEEEQEKLTGNTYCMCQNTGRGRRTTYSLNRRVLLRLRSDRDGLHRHTVDSWCPSSYQARETSVNQKNLAVRQEEKLTS